MTGLLKRHWRRGYGNRLRIEGCSSINCQMWKVRGGSKYLINGDDLAGVEVPVRLGPQNLDDAAPLGPNDGLLLLLGRGGGGGCGVLGTHRHSASAAKRRRAQGPALHAGGEERRAGGARGRGGGGEGAREAGSGGCHGDDDGGGVRVQRCREGRGVAEAVTRGRGGARHLTGCRLQSVGSGGRRVWRAWASYLDTIGWAPPHWPPPG
jgi:hypothetical protein